MPSRATLLRGTDYQLMKAIPGNLRSTLPSIEEVEEELSKIIDKN